MGQSILFSTTYSFPINEVWQALTSSDALSEWLMDNDFIPEVGHEFQFKTKGNPLFDGTVNCKVLELKENELLSFSWSGGPLKNTIVTFRLKEEGSMTRLDFEHKGFEGFLAKVMVKRIIEKGWKKTILTKNLVKYLSK